MTAPLKFHRSLDNANLPQRGAYLPELPDALQAATDTLMGLAPFAGELALIAVSVEHALQTVPGYHALEVVGVRPGRYSETDFEVDLGYVYPLNYTGKYTDAVEAAAEKAGAWSVVVGTVTICCGGPGPHFSGRHDRVDYGSREYLTAIEEADAQAS